MKLAHAVAVTTSLILSTSLSLAQSYPACDHEPTDQEVDAAKGMHKAAEQYYAKARYQDAIESWTDAYGFDCTAHPLLINIGNAYEKLNKTAKAVEAFELYLERVGDSADPTIREKVTNLRQQLAAQGEEAPPPPPPSPPPPVPDKVDDDSGPGPLPWVFVGTGVAAVVAGAIVFGIGVRNRGQVEEFCPKNTCVPGENGVRDQPHATELEADGNAANDLQFAGGAVMAVGGVLAGAGVIWYVVAVATAPDKPSTGVQVIPVVAPGHAGLVLQSSF